MDTFALNMAKTNITRRNARPRSQSPGKTHIVNNPPPLLIAKTAPNPIPGNKVHPLRRTRSGLMFTKGTFSSSSSSSSQRRRNRLIGRPPLHPNTRRNGLVKKRAPTPGIALRKNKH